MTLKPKPFKILQTKSNKSMTLIDLFSCNRLATFFSLRSCLLHFFYESDTDILHTHLAKRISIILPRASEKALTTQSLEERWMEKFTFLGDYGCEQKCHQHIYPLHLRMNNTNLISNFGRSSNGISNSIYSILSKYAHCRAGVLNGEKNI